MLVLLEMLVGGIRTRNLSPLPPPFSLHHTPTTGPNIYLHLSINVVSLVIVIWILWMSYLFFEFYSPKFGKRGINIKPLNILFY